MSNRARKFYEIKKMSIAKEHGNSFKWPVETQAERRRSKDRRNGFQAGQGGDKLGVVRANCCIHSFLFRGLLSNESHSSVVPMRKGTAFDIHVELMSRVYSLPR